MKHVKAPNLENRLKRAAAQARVRAGAALREVAERGREILKEGIEKQSFPDFTVHPLSPEYIAYKRRKGLDPRVLIRTEAYKEGIKIVEMEDGLRVGFDEKDMAVDEEGRDTKLPMNLLARFLESGTSTMPARKHFEPAAEQLRKELGRSE